MDADTERCFAAATRNRLLAAEMFAALDDDRWRTPSLCAGWTVREVLAHLVPPEGGYSTWRLARDVLRFRGDLDRMVDVTARQQARRPTAELVAELRERAGARLDPPVVRAGGPMTDTAIHLRDAARPLGLDVNPPPGDWVPVLDFLVSPRATRGFLPAGRLDGLRLVPSDLPRTWQDGPGTADVRGPAEAIALALAGRTVALADLDGPGAQILRARLSPAPGA